MSAAHHFKCISHVAVPARNKLLNLKRMSLRLAARSSASLAGVRVRVCNPPRDCKRACKRGELRASVAGTKLEGTLYVPRMHAARRAATTTTATAASGGADAGAVDDAPTSTLPALASAEELEQEKQWLAGMLALWLDEEWTPLEVHARVGAAAAEAYGALRRGGGGSGGGVGEAETSDVLLGLGSELLSFDFSEAFVGPFDVANKTVEMLMMRHGVDVCCTSPEDAERLSRYDSSMSSGDGG